MLELEMQKVVFPPGFEVAQAKQKPIIARGTPLWQVQQRWPQSSLTVLQA